eukprot:2571846-Rhodomonas_salina.2
MDADITGLSRSLFDVFLTRVVPDLRCRLRRHWALAMVKIILVSSPLIVIAHCVSFVALFRRSTSFPAARWLCEKAHATRANSGLQRIVLSKFGIKIFADPPKPATTESAKGKSSTPKSSKKKAKVAPMPASVSTYSVSVPFGSTGPVPDRVASWTQVHTGVGVGKPISFFFFLLGMRGAACFVRRQRRSGLDVVCAREMSNGVHMCGEGDAWGDGAGCGGVGGSNLPRGSLGADRKADHHCGAHACCYCV